MSLLYGGKRGDGGYNDDGDNRHKHHGNCDEEQESCYFVRDYVRELEASIHHKRRKLIHNFNRNDYSCPQP